MAASGDNVNVKGDSYQKQYDGATGTRAYDYQEIPNGAGVKKKKWMVGIALFAVLVYGVNVITMRSNPEKKNVKLLAESDYSNNSYPYVKVAMIGNSMMYVNDLPRFMGASKSRNSLFYCEKLETTFKNTHSH